LKPFREPLFHGMSFAQGSAASIQPSSGQKSRTPDAGSGSISKGKEHAQHFEAEYCSVDSDYDIKLLYSVADIISGQGAHGEASLRTVSAPTASEKIGDSSEQIIIPPPTSQQTPRTGERFVPPRSSVPQLSDDDDAFMEDVQRKQVTKAKGKGVVRKATRYDDTDGGLPSHTMLPVVTERRQPHGCHSVYKSANLTDDLEEPGTSMKQLGRGRGATKSAGRGIGRGAGSTKVLSKKQKTGK
jgi:hypothetical protein